MQNKWAHRIATVGHIGCLPRAPGTWGTLSALPVIFLLPSRPEALAAAAGFIFLLGLWSSHAVSSDTGHADPQHVVIDEVCGMMVSVLWIPMTWQRMVLGFFLFRFFDIVKPPPARALERLHGGFGVMLDDVMAGIYVQMVLRLGIMYAHL